MLIFDGFDFQSRVIKLRPRQLETCLMCKHASESLTIEDVENIMENVDYNQFCGVSNYNDKTLDISVLDESKRVTCAQYNKEFLNESSKSHLLIDVRPKCQFKICALPNSISNYLNFF